MSFFFVARLSLCYSEFKTVPEKDRQECH